MTHSNTVQLQQTPMFGLKPLLAIKDYILLLISAFSEAKALVQKSRKISGNW